MNMQHVIKINNRIYEIIKPGQSLIVGTGRQFAIYHPATCKMVVKHALTGKFISLKTGDLS